MDSGNKMKQQMMQVTSRQKIIIVTIIIVVLIIIWQLMGLIDGGSSNEKPVEPVTKMSATAPAGKMTANAPNQSAAMQTKLANEPLSNTPTETPLKQGSIINEPQFNKMQRQTEEKYVGKLNELEELRIQRQIAETNQAIAAAKLATVTAEKDISDLLTKPAYEVYNQPGMSPTALPTSGTAGATALSTPVAAPKQEVAPYVLVSVSMLLNKWNAVISLQGTMYNVSVGDALPPDGSVVTNINKNSVTLRKDGKSHRVSLTSSI